LVEDRADGFEFYGVMATIQALETTELLEIVLLHLSLKDIFCVQRVCRAWREAILYSPQLQQLTFLGRGPRQLPRTKTVRNNSVYDERNATREERMKSDAMPVSVRLNDGTTRAKPVIYTEVAFNPVFPSEENVIRFLTTQLQTTQYSNPSWLDMYLTQPPCSYVYVTVYYTKQRPRSMFTGWRIKSSPTGKYLVEVRREDGVKARDILAEARRCSSAKDVVQWHRIDMFVPGVVKRSP
jgi:hypothetical protein